MIQDRFLSRPSQRTGGHQYRIKNIEVDSITKHPAQITSCFVQTCVKVGPSEGLVRQNRLQRTVSVQAGETVDPTGCDD